MIQQILYLIAQLRKFHKIKEVNDTNFSFKINITPRICLLFAAIEIIFCTQLQTTKQLQLQTITTTKQNAEMVRKMFLGLVDSYCPLLESCWSLDVTSTRPQGSRLKFYNAPALTINLFKL